MWRSLSLIEVIYFAFSLSLHPRLRCSWQNLLATSTLSLIRSGDYFRTARTKYFAKSFHCEILIRNRSLGTFQTFRQLRDCLSNDWRTDYGIITAATLWSTHRSLASWTAGFFPFPANTLITQHHHYTFSFFLFLRAPHCWVRWTADVLFFVAARKIRVTKSRECVTFGKWRIVVKRAKKVVKKFFIKLNSFGLLQPFVVRLVRGRRWWIWGEIGRPSPGGAIKVRWFQLSGDLLKNRSKFN